MLYTDSLVLGAELKEGRDTGLNNDKKLILLFNSFNFVAIKSFQRRSVYLYIFFFSLFSQHANHLAIQNN